MSILGKLRNCLTNALSIAFFKEFPPAGRGGAKVNILLSNKKNVASFFNNFNYYMAEINAAS